MPSLWQKEVRANVPFWALAVFIPATSFVFELFTDPPNMRPLVTTFEDYIAMTSFGSVLVLLVTLGLTSGLLVREHDDGTMEFLDSLPVSRSRVFLAKVTTAFFVLLLLTVLDMGTAVLLHALSRNSLDSRFHLPLLATAGLLRVCQIFVFLSLGLALSFLRRFGWLVIGLLFWGFMWMHENLPQTELLNLFALVKPHFEGNRWVVPYTQLGVQLTLAAVLMLVAYGLFLGSGDRLIRGYQKLAQNRAGAAALLAGGAMIAMVGFALAYQFFEEEFGTDPEAFDEVTITYPEWSTSRRRTERFEFIYPTNLAGRAAPLMDRADAAHEKIRSFFAADAGQRIVVDATSLLPRHAGIAYWQKIRLDLTDDEDVDSLEATLGHETVHIFLDRLSDWRLHEQFNSTRFFHEGVATYLEYRRFEREPHIDAHRSVAAVMRARDEVDFRELVDNERFLERRDTNLVYPLGEVFVSALVERYGDESVGRIVRALVRDDAPQGLSGQELWRDVFQACGYNLDDVLDGFYVMLDDEVQRHQQLIDTLPRLRGAVTSDGETVYVNAEWDPVEGWTPVCRFRQAKDSPDRQYMFAVTNPDLAGTFWIDRANFPGATVWYQLGLRDDKSRVIYEPWIEVVVSRGPG